MKPITPTHPEEFLPLKPSVLAILMSLDEEPRHGYAIIQAVRKQSGGSIALDTGPLYRYLKRLLDDGLVEEIADDTAPDRRRCYQPTTLGQEVLAAEVSRLKHLLDPGRRASSQRASR